MPDPNKLQILNEIGYQVQDCCGNCQHGKFAPSLDWGSCRIQTYDHEKHGTRDLSVNRAGVCPKFEINQKKLADLTRSGFDQFRGNDD